jgi:NTP pyrophosphatase (non-canonical NTP hydrolase)
MSETLGLRDPLARFAIEMERQLRANDHKTGWTDCEQRWLLNRLKQETAELERALTSGKNIVKETADVANFAMMIADNALEYVPPPAEHEHRIDLDGGCFECEARSIPHDAI